MMRKILLLVLFTLAASTCAYNEKYPATVRQPEITSWETLTPQALNLKIQQARRAGKAWPAKPERVIFHLFDLSDLKSVDYQYRTDKIEAPTQIKIQLIRDGFLDDAVRGDIHQLKLNRQAGGDWKITSLKKTTRCWRFNPAVYASTPCP